MWCLVLWALGFPRRLAILYHCFFSLTLLVIYLFYRIYNNCKLRRALRPVVQVDRGRIGIMSSKELSRYNRISHAALVLVLVLSCVSCLENDAALLTPLAGLAKSIIKTATLGAPLEINFSVSDLVKNFASLTWRTGFPVSMPRGFFEKVQEFYNRISDRVAQTSVKEVERKSLANLKVDLDNIVDSIVEEVRRSPDGIYTDYLQTQVNGVPLEQACFEIGLQLKAYGVDLINYRDIAGVVLGVPLMPTVASTVVGVAKMAPGLGTMSNLTTNIANAQVKDIPSAAFNVFSSVSSTALNPFNQILQRNLFDRKAAQPQLPPPMQQTVNQQPLLVSS